MTTPPVPPEAVTAALKAVRADGWSEDTTGVVGRVCRIALEAAVPVLRDHWQAGGALHELVFTDREARPAKWRTRCGREDVPLERTTSPDPAGYYQVDCPACLRVAELESLAAEMLAICEQAGRRIPGRWRVTLAGTP